jgi:hypothetical protein
MDSAREWVVRGPLDGVVEAWSEIRLPFEPRGSAVEFRAALRRSLRQLSETSNAGYPLSATYASVDRSFVDIENVLLYNVGNSAFGRPASIFIERQYKDPPPAPDGRAPLDFRHYHRYGAAEDTTITSWSLGSPACFWDAPLVAGSASLSDAAAIWYSLRRSIQALGPDLRNGSYFAVSVTIEGPGVSRRSLPEMTKKVLDGLISAGHRHDGTDLSELSVRVAKKLTADPSEVAALLAGQGPAPLGARRLLGRFRTTVQWNPADDLCVLAALRAVEGPAWRIKGHLSPASLGSSDQ